MDRMGDGGLDDEWQRMQQAGRAARRAALPGGSFCMPTTDSCEGGLCVDNKCRTGCEKGQPCSEGTSCRSVDLSITLHEPSGNKVDKHAVDKNYLLCMPPPP